MPAKVMLEVTSGPIKGKVFSFEDHDTFLFGRTADCHIGLPKDGCVSRHHFILEVNPPDARIRDLGSLNGTVVNDVKYGGRAPDESPQDVAGRELSPLRTAQASFPACGSSNSVGPPPQRTRQVLFVRAMGRTRPRRP